MTEQVQDQTQPDGLSDGLKDLEDLMRAVQLSSKTLIVSKIQGEVWPFIVKVGHTDVAAGKMMSDMSVDALIEVAATMVYFEESGVSEKLFTVKDKKYRQKMTEAHDDNLNKISRSGKLTAVVKAAIKSFLTDEMKPVEDIGPPPVEPAEPVEVNAETSANLQTPSNEGMIVTAGTTEGDGSNVPAN